MVSGIQLAVGTLREPLEQMGLRKRASEIFTLPLADGVLGWLGLNHATHHRPPGEVAIHPVVGVRHQAVERLIARLRSESFHEYLPPTISTPIVHVMSESRYMAWEFGGQHGTTAAADLISALADYGVPFMRAHVRLPAIVEAIGQGFCQNPEYRLPASLEVMGRHNEAKAVMARFVDELGGRQDLAAQQLRNFASALSTEIDLLLSGNPDDNDS